MIRVWGRLAGVSLPQGYRLEKCLREEESGAFYLTSLARGGGPADQPAAQPAVLKLVEGHSAAAGQLAAWQRLAGLSHPNLLALVDCGRASSLGTDDGQFLYAVFEYPDDHLASALEAGPLSPSDARDVTDAVEAGLRFLHQHGLAHGSVDPQHVVAVGDRIKLSSDTVKPLSPETTEAADWKACSALRSAMLGSSNGNPPDAAGTVSGTASAAAADSTGVPAEALSETPSSPGPENAPSYHPEPGVSVAADSLGRPLPEQGKPHRLPDAANPPRMPQAGKSRHLRLWGYAALSAVLAYLAVLAFRQKPAPATGAPPNPVRVAQAPAPAVQVPAPAVPPATRPSPFRAATQSADRAEAPIEARKSKPTLSPTSDPPTWRVVAYTYNQRKDADHKVAQIRARFPGFDPEVFSPNGGNQPPYLVSLRGRMTRSQAQMLQRQALGKGLPPDTYFQNFRY